MVGTALRPNESTGERVMVKESKRKQEREASRIISYEIPNICINGISGGNDDQQPNQQKQQT